MEEDETWYTGRVLKICALVAVPILGSRILQIDGHLVYKYKANAGLITHKDLENAHQKPSRYGR